LGRRSIGNSVEIAALLGPVNLVVLGRNLEDLIDPNRDSALLSDLERVMGEVVGVVVVVEEAIRRRASVLMK
jgi:hypothetical protein